MFTKKIIIFTILSLFLSAGYLQAACPLESINNLSIDTQIPDDIPNIIRLQSILYINNLYDGPITGYYGNLTKTAINKFKKSYNLSANGTVDNNTINILCDNYTLCPFQSFLQNGSESPKKEIKFIQYFLKLIPNIYPEKLVTGYFGTKTENAVKRLQKSLNISQTGKIDESTRETFCNFFANFGITDTDSKDNQDNTSPISKVVCVASTKQADINETVTFISQIIGNQNSPFKYIWNNKATNNQKTFEISFTSSGAKTVNLKVIDSKGEILTTNCSVKIGSSTDDIDDSDDDIDLPIDVDPGENDQDDSTDQNSTYQEPTDVEKYISKNWNNFTSLNAQKYPLTINLTAKLIGDYSCFSYDEAMTIAKDDQSKYKTYAQKGFHPDSNTYNYYKTHYYNMYTGQCVHGSYILKDSNNQPCYYYQGPFYYPDCNHIGSYFDPNRIYIDAEWKYRKQKLSDSDYINFDLTWDDFKSCHPYYSKQTLLGNFSPKSFSSEPVTMRNLKLMPDGNIKYIKYSPTEYQSKLNYAEQLQNQNNTNASNNTDTSSNQNKTTTQQSSSNNIIYTYTRHKCSNTEGCVPCDPKEWCQFDSYWNCLDYCWAEQAKPEIQRKTEKSDTPQDFEPQESTPQTPFNPLAPILKKAQELHDNALSGKYKCAFGSQCIPCTNAQVKTDQTCWYDSADDCKSQCGKSDY